MAFLYILQSLINHKYYIGSTVNIKRRIEEHNRGQTKSTRFSKPYKLVFTQQFDSINQAKKIEYKLKRFKNRKIIDKIIQDQNVRLRS